VLDQTGDDVLRRGLDRFSTDLASGRWHKRHMHLLQFRDFDPGYRLLVAEQWSVACNGLSWQAAGLASVASMASSSKNIWWLLALGQPAQRLPA
jgi:hypothetical protein